MTFLRTSSSISRDTMEWLLYMVTNLNGDSSFLTIPAPSIDLLPLSKDPPSGESARPSDDQGQQVGEEVVFDGNLDDLVGGILHNEIEQVKHNKVQDMVI